ncbi:unnamed protein product, partial [Callosobruchus maculatus]
MWLQLRVPANRGGNTQIHCKIQIGIACTVGLKIYRCYILQ